ncbi:HDIG domain-containing metalloprotein [Natranaerofaba carboxydovora]|uniref:HDIG domain-containing metalloprotein n=1 Tax=Natranaerofaba carboxydovora TaxID=2742683 RepID=UPI001F141CD0|nr:HDIG domain-containing metalloprotein [Natranaerofaba carboxydovora]UMZ72663.1 HD domain protein [Natranaerofaba carboxydovora]
MNREEALKFLKENVENENLIKHSLAVEAVMKKLANKMDKDAEKWALAGLLHDVDYEKTKDEPEKHSKISAEMLEEKNVDEDICYAVKVHNDIHELPRNSEIDKALYCADPVTGLIVAAALIHPDKSLGSIDLEFLINRFNETSFAKGAKRAQIAACEELDMELEEFLELSLEAMCDISDSIDL